jgi:hypothetical protein
VLHRLGRTLLFKSEKSIVRNNPITALQLLLNDAKDTLKRVKEKISHVDGVRIDMIQSGTHSQKTREEKYALVKRLVADASKQAEQSVEVNKANNIEKANDLNRVAKETRTKAFLFGKEGEAEEHNARSYAQYANQFSKVIEVLKDNESAARIYVSTLDSSITILHKKMEATKKMKNAAAPTGHSRRRSGRVKKKLSADFHGLDKNWIGSYLFLRNKKMAKTIRLTHAYPVYHYLPVLCREYP